VVHGGVDVALPLQSLLDLGLGLGLVPVWFEPHFSLYQSIHQMWVDELLDLVFALVAVVDGAEDVIVSDGL